MPQNSAYIDQLTTEFKNSLASKNMGGRVKIDLELDTRPTPCAKMNVTSVKPPLDPMTKTIIMSLIETRAQELIDAGKISGCEITWTPANNPI